MEEEPLIKPHGGYQGLRAFQMSEFVYDGTVAFTRLYLDSKSRTVDQMVQAARSGRQNIAEGSMASGTNSKMELKLVGVARASQEELPWTTATSCASATSPSGPKTTRKPYSSESSVIERIGPI